MQKINFPSLFLLLPLLLGGAIPPVQAKMIWDEIGPHRGSGRNNIGPSDLPLPVHPIEIRTPTPTQGPNELLWTPTTTTRIADH